MMPITLVKSRCSRRRCSLLRIRRHLPESAFLSGHLQQRRIKLHERVVDGAVFRVAGLTFRGCGRRGFRCLFGAAEGEEAPFSWKPPFIFDFGLDSDQVSLKMSIFVDRAVGLRRSARSILTPSVRTTSNQTRRKQIPAGSAARLFLFGISIRPPRAIIIRLVWQLLNVVGGCIPLLAELAEEGWREAPGWSVRPN